jgi:muramoyltetrapeptide carboxypeptidase
VQRPEWESGMGVKLIGIVAPASRLDAALAEAVRALAAGMEDAPQLLFHPQCFLSSGHFAGDDDTRARAFLDVANDSNFDVLWIGRGGYGSCRIAERVLAQLNGAARQKLYLGYSDAGALLAGLYRHGCRVAHGPMPADLLRAGGEAAVNRALSWLCRSDRSGLEPSLEPGIPSAAFNMIVFSQLLGTALEPDLTDHVLMLEEVSEHLYGIDRTMFHITSTPSIRRVKGIRLGRVSDILPNEPAFAENEEEIVRRWCDGAGIAYLGRADIGHDSGNKIVPYGTY